MSMRIEGQTDVKVISTVRSAGNKTASQESTTAHMPVPSLGSDNVSLSSASGLLSLTKTLTPGDKQAKVAALASQVRSGQYRPNASEISRSIVQGLLSN